ncbi:efflux RND transporter periplasmic adaptor subunit [Pontibacterium sp.]|jgi:biotin carboxyl carrier protein|uniref:efflux RND transporter periplasmic adaptor subunit n=1 Tax=Pontibacterium sp. TaxID=2036026 RepID=UPI0035682DC7
MTQALQSGQQRTRSSTFFKWLLPLLFIAIAVAVFMYMRATKPQAPSRPVAEKIWAVSVTPASLEAHQPELVLYGKVETPRMSTLSAAVTAYVQTAPTDAGRTFSADETLLQLDDRDIRLLVAQREADLHNAEAQLSAENVRYNADLKALKIEKNLLALSKQSVSRIENLNKRNLTSQEQLDNARRSAQQQALSLNTRQQAINDHPNRLKQITASVTRTKALYDTALLDLERTRISTSFDGRIAQLHVAPGDRVRSGDPLLTVYGLDRLEVRAQVPSRILPLIRNALNDQGTISASSQLDEQQLALQLDRLAGEVNSGRAGVDAFFRIESSTSLPEPGRSVAIDLKLPVQQNVVALPPQALYGTNRIYRIVDDRLEAIDVERVGDITTDSGKTRILVRSADLQQGDSVVTTQLPNAISGLKVREAGK